MTKEEFKTNMIIKAEKLAGDDSKPLAVTLVNGSKVIGRSLGMELDEDEDGNEFNVLAFDCPDLHHIFWFKADEIKKVELA